MNAKNLLAALVAALAAPALFAEDAATPDSKPAPATPDAKPAAAKYQLKAHSVCNIAPGTRPPFWPIGWVHREGPHQEIQVGPKFTLDPKNFAVTSILLGQPAIAVINGRAYEEGQFLKIKMAAPALGAPAAPVPRVRVHRIADGQVWLAFDNQIVSVELKRPELNERKAEQEVLNEDKEDVAPAPAVSSR